MFTHTTLLLLSIVAIVGIFGYILIKLYTRIVKLKGELIHLNTAIVKLTEKTHRVENMYDLLEVDIKAKLDNILKTTETSKKTILDILNYQKK